jgi:tetratricopeptide (TPR) repeat protein
MKNFLLFFITTVILISIINLNPLLSFRKIIPTDKEQETWEKATTSEKLEICNKKYKQLINKNPGKTHLDSMKHAMEMHKTALRLGKLNNYEKSIILLKKSASLLKKINEHKKYSDVLSDLAILYRELYYLDKALDASLESLKTREKIEDSNGIAISYTNLGNVYYDLKDYEKSLSYYKDAYELKIKINDTSNLNIQYMNIGNIYNEKGEYNKALLYQYRALKICESMNDTIGIVSSLINIGNNYYFQKNYKNALEVYLKAWDINTNSKKINDEENTAILSLNIGDCYSRIGKYQKASEYLEKSLALSKEFNLNSYLEDIYKLLMNNYYHLRNYQKAFKYSKSYMAVKDSLFNLAVIYKITEAENEYKKEKERLEKLRQKEILEKAKNERITLHYLSIILIVILLFITLFILGKYNMPPNYVKGMIFITFILLFEFIMLLSEGPIENYIGTDPLYKLSGNLVLAIILSPLHRILVDKLGKRML